MGLFARKNKVAESSATSEEAAKRIAMGILSKQRRLADYLNAKVSSLPSRSLTIMLLLFCLGFGAYCLYLLYGAIN